MRICIITHARTPFGYRHAKAFQRHGHEVELFSLYRDRPIMDGVTVRCFGPSDFTPSKTRSRLPYLKSILPIRRAIRRYQPDIVMAIYLSSGGVVGRLCGASNLVVSARGSDVMEKRGSFIWRPVIRWVCKGAALVHVVADHLGNSLCKDFGVDPKKIVVAPLGVNTSELPYVDPSSRPGTGQILCTRGHKPVYGQDSLLRALKNLKDRGFTCHLTFASNRDAEMSERLVEQMGLRDMVTFLGGYKLEELPSILASADVYVSASYRDGTSNSLLEALSTGTFPVVSNIPANRPWIDHGRNGLLFPPGDADALADALARALKDSALRSEAAAINRQIAVERADSDVHARRLLEAFEKCLTR